MAYKRKYASKRRTAFKRRTYKRRSVGSKSSSFAKRVKRVILKTCEPKFKETTAGLIQLNHNVVSVTNLNGGSNVLPAQGIGDNNRIGDQINLTALKLRMLVGQKDDRPNVTFRWFVTWTPKGYSYTYNKWFDNISGNALLDNVNTDVVRVLKRGVWRSKELGLVATQKEATMVKHIYVPYRKILKFSVDGDIAPNHNDGDVNFIIVAYDAFGSLITDTIGYIQPVLTWYYRDP